MFVGGPWLIRSHFKYVSLFFSFFFFLAYVLLFRASLRFEDEIKRGSTIGIRRLIMDDRMMLRKHHMGKFLSICCCCWWEFLPIILPMIVTKLFSRLSKVKLRNFLCDCIGKPYESQILQLLKVFSFFLFVSPSSFTKSIPKASTGGNTEEDTRSFFCSELVACALKEMGKNNFYY